MTIRERRQHPRANERLALAVTDAGAELVTETKNLSASGVSCTVDRFIAPMSKLQIRFALPTTERCSTEIRCSGVVVRVEPVIANADQGFYNVAVLFTELAERDRLTIARFVRQHLPASSSAH